LILALSISKVKFQILKIKALPKRIESSHWRTRKGERVTSASAEETYNSLNKYAKLNELAKAKN
jgi:ATP-dependent Clp protease ATP-binding subunit ClpB